MRGVMAEPDATKATPWETIAHSRAHPVLGRVRRRWLFLCILAVGLAVRLFRFGQVPPGLGQDEAAIGYDAFALLHYGIDRSGFHNPVMFVSWGSGMDAINGYLSMPFIAVLGLSPFSVRIANLMVGLVGLV